ncbi:helix-turn-helix transcriptional regulator [Pseudomonas sp. LRF_L74]|uniref:helix-turn-helix transcriptional regulator n=1 Tax=Pseudomonas sp. LRF_L74 TaxID=3369422 RepID=UPI003F5E5F8D
MTSKPLDRLIKLDEVMQQIGVGKTKVYDMIQLEEFPAPIKLGRYSRWSLIEVQDWIEQQKQSRAA